MSIIKNKLRVLKRNIRENIQGNEVYNILLLTNRDSDNVGDQVIEASDLSLIGAVMKNLKISRLNYKINSRAAAIVSRKYLETRNPEYLKDAENAIQNCDIVVFGGAPMFNYLYQNFYERTAVTLELAEKYNKPVIFSAIGVERYEETNAKCQRLKKALNLDCVKQITTRDGIEELTKYKANDSMIIDRVADPAVFCGQALRKFVKNREVKEKKKIGIFVFRANGFKDNKINFSKEDAVKLWKQIINECNEKNYDYELLTSGHFGDEAFMDYLIRKHGVDEKKCVFNINSPEDLIKKISSYDGVISCRLHPSIISYSLDVPSVGIIWNSKVTHFYNCIGYANRSLAVDQYDAKGIVERLELAMNEGIEKDKDYLMSVYNYLFSGIKNALNLKDTDIAAYSYERLMQEMPEFKGTSINEKELKLKRKFRRAYDTLNVRTQKIEELKSENIAVHFHSGAVGDLVQVMQDVTAMVDGNHKRLASGAIELKLNKQFQNDGKIMMIPCPYENGNSTFKGWRIRFRIDEVWFWILADNSYCETERYEKSIHGEYMVFPHDEKLPKLPFTSISSIVGEAVWEN